MGITVFAPTIKGIDDYKQSEVNHILVQISNETNQIELFTVFFDLPDFASMPQMYLRQLTGNLQIMLVNNDLSQTQAYISVNGIFTFQDQNYYASQLHKAFESIQIKVLEETKIFPEDSSIMPIKDTMTQFAKFIQMNPHAYVLPVEHNYKFFLDRIGLTKYQGIIKNPHIKILHNPLRVIKILGTMSSFSEDDSNFEAILTSLNGDLAATSIVAFEGGFAYKALWNAFNLQALSRRDKLEINAFKILSLKVIINNMDMKELDKIMVHKTSFLEKGIKIQLELELKKYCEADVFCIILTKYYGSMFKMTLEGEVSQIKKEITLKSNIKSIQFNDKYMMDQCTLNLYINYENLEKPDIQIYIQGNFIGEVQKGATLNFKSKLQFSEEGAVRLKGEMNDIFVNAFNLNNMINMTQMTIQTAIDQEGQLSDLDVNGVAVFGADCYKVSMIPQIFNNSNPMPYFNAKQQLQLLALLNQSFINQDNCETANIIMRINVSNYQENAFQGKLNLINLKQFYKIFFSQIADKLTSLTPNNIRDQQYINHQVNLIYEPGQVLINGIELQGAFIFSGLLDFHGIQAKMKIVMDPTYQKFLYFTIVTPSFSISKDNIKFLSPMEYVDILNDNTKAILNAFGPPKIELQIPIEDLNIDFITFNMKAVVSMFGMQQMINAEIINQKMNFQMRGNLFNGIYKALIKVTAIISDGHISDNLASVYGQFDIDQNVKEIENHLNKRVQQWYSTGLRYQKAWSDRINNLERMIDDIKETTFCDPYQCPSYSQCSSNLIIKCRKYEQEYECARHQEICTDLQQKCIKTEKLCARKMKGECFSYVEVCTEWSNQCLGYNQKVCKRFRLKPDIKSNHICTVFDVTCNMQSRIDQDCFMRCEQSQTKFHQYQSLMESYQRIMNYSDSIFGNMTKIEKDFFANVKQGLSFVNIKNITLEGLIDDYLVPQNTNISIELNYNSMIDNKQRLIRSSIDYHSNSETAKKLLLFILEDICSIYGIPTRIASQMNMIIEEIEGSLKMLQRGQNMTNDEIETKFQDIIIAQNKIQREDNGRGDYDVTYGLDRNALAEKKLSKIMLEQDLNTDNKYNSNLCEIVDFKVLSISECIIRIKKREAK